MKYKLLRWFALGRLILRNPRRIKPIFAEYANNNVERTLWVLGSLTMFWSLRMFLYFVAMAVLLPHTRWNEPRRDFWKSERWWWILLALEASIWILVPDVIGVTGSLIAAWLMVLFAIFAKLCPIRWLRNLPDSDLFFITGIVGGVTVAILSLFILLAVRLFGYLW